MAVGSDGDEMPYSTSVPIIRCMTSSLGEVRIRLSKPGDPGDGQGVPAQSGRRTNPDLRRQPVRGWCATSVPVRTTASSRSSRHGRGRTLVPGARLAVGADPAGPMATAVAAVGAAMLAAYATLQACLLAIFFDHRRPRRLHRRKPTTVRMGHPGVAGGSPSRWPPSSAGWCPGWRAGGPARPSRPQRWPSRSPAESSYPARSNWPGTPSSWAVVLLLTGCGVGSVLGLGGAHDAVASRRWSAPWRSGPCRSCC